MTPVSSGIELSRGAIKTQRKLILKEAGFMSSPFAFNDWWALASIVEISMAIELLQ